MAIVAISVAVHLGFFALVSAQLQPRPVVDPVATQVALVDLRSLAPPAPPAVPAPDEPKPPEPTPPEPAPAEPKPVKAVPKRAMVRPTPAPRVVPTLAADKEPAGDAVAELSDAQLAQAATADSGPAGGACTMVRWLQGALRKNAKVQAAVARTHRAGAGKAVVMWNGDWVRISGEEGDGLAGVREAIMMEVAFAPAACREPQPMHRVVLISLADGPSAPRVALGSDFWRWSDLLGAHSGAPVTLTR